MRINIDPEFVVEGDEGCLKLIRVKTITGDNTRGKKANPDKIGTTRDEVLGFYACWEHVLSGYLQKFSAESDATSVKELLAVIKTAEQNIKDLVTKNNLTKIK